MNKVSRSCKIPSRSNSGLRQAATTLLLRQQERKKWNCSLHRTSGRNHVLALGPNLHSPPIKFRKWCSPPVVSEKLRTASDIDSSLISKRWHSVINIFLVLEIEAEYYCLVIPFGHIKTKTKTFFGVWAPSNWNIQISTTLCKVSESINTADILDSFSSRIQFGLCLAVRQQRSPNENTAHAQVCMYLFYHACKVSWKMEGA